jgi:uncharacterized coiled-coil protein SlyX
MALMSFEINSVQFQQLIQCLNQVNQNLGLLNGTISKSISTAAQAAQINQLTAKLKQSSGSLANAVSAEETPTE